MKSSQYVLLFLISLFAGLIIYSYLKQTNSSILPAPSPTPSPTTTPPTTITTFNTTQPYILQIETNGQTVISPRALFGSIESVFITTNTTAVSTTYANVYPIYSYYLLTTAFNLTNNISINYNVQYGYYNVIHSGITTIIPVYSPNPVPLTNTIPIKVLNVNGNLLTSYNGNVYLPTTLVTTYVTYDSTIPIRYYFTNPYGHIVTTAESVTIYTTTQVIFSISPKITVENGVGNMIVSVFEKNSTNQFKVGADICQSVASRLSGMTVDCLIFYSTTTSTEDNYILKASSSIALQKNSAVGISTNSTTFIPANQCTPFKNTVVTIESANASYNGGIYKLEVQPQGLSFSLGNIYICPSLLGQQINIEVYVQQY